MLPGFVLLNKEEVNQLRFPSSEILNNQFEKDKRGLNIDFATKLGNVAKHKVLIVFCDDKQTLSVYTTLWGYTNEVVLLKGNLYLPIHRIRSVTLL